MINNECGILEVPKSASNLAKFGLVGKTVWKQANPNILGQWFRLIPYRGRTCFNFQVSLSLLA